MPEDSYVDTSPGAPNLQRTVNAEGQPDGDTCQEAMSLLNHTTDNSDFPEDERDLSGLSEAC